MNADQEPHCQSAVSMIDSGIDTAGIAIANSLLMADEATTEVLGDLDQTVATLPVLGAPVRAALDPVLTPLNERLVDTKSGLLGSTAGTVGTVVPDLVEVRERPGVSAEEGPAAGTVDREGSSPSVAARDQDGARPEIPDAVVGGPTSPAASAPAPAPEEQRVELSPAEQAIDRSLVARGSESPLSAKKASSRGWGPHWTVSDGTFGCGPMGAFGGPMCPGALAPAGSSGSVGSSGGSPSMDGVFTRSAAPTTPAELGVPGAAGERSWVLVFPPECAPD